MNKYSHKVLRTNPKKINVFYTSLFQVEDNPVQDNPDVDCQYRNYNEIVEELIKATTEGDENLHEDEKDKSYEG